MLRVIRLPFSEYRMYQILFLKNTVTRPTRNDFRGPDREVDLAFLRLPDFDFWAGSLLDFFLWFSLVCGSIFYIPRSSLRHKAQQKRYKRDFEEKPETRKARYSLGLNNGLLKIAEMTGFEPAEQFDPFT